MTGADISAALIGKARQAEREHPLGLQYVHADVSSPGWHASLDAAAFDVVTCHFGLSDIDDLDGALAGASAVLRPRGCLRTNRLARRAALLGRRRLIPGGEQVAEADHAVDPPPSPRSAGGGSRSGA